MRQSGESLGSGSSIKLLLLPGSMTSPPLLRKINLHKKIDHEGRKLGNTNVAMHLKCALKYAKNNAVSPLVRALALKDVDQKRNIIAQGSDTFSNALIRQCLLYPGASLDIWGQYPVFF